MLQSMILGGGGGGGGGALVPVDIEFLVSNVTVETDGTSGLRYLPLVEGGTEPCSFQFIAPRTGEIAIRVAYAMSASNGGDVALRLDSLITTEGSNPSTALTAGTPFTITPGSNTTRHTVNEEDSGDLQMTVVAGDIVRCLLDRPTSGDTHTADFKIYKIWAQPL